jgi:elongation factor P
VLTTADFGKGVRILMNGAPYMILDVTMQSAQGRGSNTLVKFKARNLLTGQLVNEAVKNGSKFEEPDLHYTNVQYLYSDGDQAVFMDQDSYEQVSMPLTIVGDQARYLRDDVKIKAMYFNGAPVSVEFPQHVSMLVDTVEPADRGNTATGTVMTRALLAGGFECKVPVHVKAGDTILVDSTEHTFYQRVQ